MPNTLNVNVEEVRALADFLDKLPPANFNLHRWGIDLHEEVDTHCGTVACVAGWQVVRMSLARGMDHRVFHNLARSNESIFSVDYGTSPHIQQLAHDYALDVRPHGVSPIAKSEAVGANWYLPRKLAARSLNITNDSMQEMIFALNDDMTETFYTLYGGVYNVMPSAKQVAKALRAFADDPDGVYDRVITAVIEKRKQDDD